MVARGFRAPSVAAFVLLVSGILGAAGTTRMSRQYVEGARTLSLFEVGVEVAAVSPALELSLSYLNPGPWPVTLLEVQVLAWHGGDYLGAASRDLRQNPLVVAPSSTGQLTLTFPAGTETARPPAGDGAGASWRFYLSGRLELPVLGARTFSREAVYSDVEGS